ncbi:cysteine protease StiP family protein [Candidatus Soleaferrea massiliensis]|uniref:cysteine protease StiP family protein n=1 Tax=Candidatus Soleaferrea massiliensis TaxID=1470354 RepID=UPI00058E942E|nr:cysteine protease StiP family protein [Candidatus Soleaferrea massiliensis]
MIREQNRAKGSFLEEDVTLLLKDVSSLVEERPTAVREKEIQHGRHYCMDLPIEKLPSEEYMKIFHQLFRENCGRVALYTAVLTQLVLQEFSHPVFVSLVRAGTPAGVLMRRYAQRYLHREVAHYGLSIIRGVGFDENALKDILSAHPGCTPVFVDGWTGKGMIASQLKESCEVFNKKYGTAVRPVLAVLSDPACCTDLYATREDFVNPSSCLNSTVCGLISRSVLNEAFIGPDDYHGVKVYEKFKNDDLTAFYLDGVTELFEDVQAQAQRMLDALLREDRTPTFRGMSAVREIAAVFGVDDINRVKPSIGETTRVLLRRVPDRILLQDTESAQVAHILQLAKEKNVPVEVYRDMPYICCGLISNQKRVEL